MASNLFLCMFLTLECRFNFLVYLFVLSVSIPSSAHNAVWLVAREHLSIFQLLPSVLFTSYAFTSHTSPAYSGLGTFTFVRMHLLILVSRCESVRITSIWPTCVFTLSTTFAMCVSHERYFKTSTPLYIYWSTIGASSPPHFQLIFTGFTLYSLHTTTAHFLTFAVTLHFLVYFSALSISFCYPWGVLDIPKKPYGSINPGLVSSPTVTPCLAVSTATIRSLLYTCI